MTRGIINNNPGNIRLGAVKWQGEIDGADPAFIKFSGPEYGIRALAKILLTYFNKYQLRTVEAIINRWAPPAENDTEGYISDVARRMNVAPDETLDLTSHVILLDITEAIIVHENGQNPYDLATLSKGVGLAEAA
jgi:hypothetical protein